MHGGERNHKWRRLGGVISVLACGVILGVVKGNGGEIRSAIGNMSAVWLVLPLLVGWRAGSAVRGAIIGLAATILALVGFYLGVIPYLHEYSANMLGGLTDVLVANRIWFTFGVLSGSVCGAVAGWLGSRLAMWWLGVLAGAAFIGELPVIAAIHNRPLPVLGWSWAVDRTGWAAYAAQTLFGCLVLAVSIIHGRRGRTMPTA